MKRPRVEDVKQITWRDGRFSDWTIRLGSQDFKVHRQVLAGGGRACHFFVGAFNEGYEHSACCSDLTQSLPVETHCVFEAALDFIYGSTEKLFTPQNSCALWKIADFLQCPTLSKEIEQYIAEFPNGSHSLLVLAKEALQIQGLEELSKVLLPRVSRAHLHDLVPVAVQLASEEARQSLFSSLLSCAQPVWISASRCRSIVGQVVSNKGKSKGKPWEKGKGKGKCFFGAEEVVLSSPCKGKGKCKGKVVECDRCIEQQLTRPSWKMHIKHCSSDGLVVGIHFVTLGLGVGLQAGGIVMTLRLTDPTQPEIVSERDVGVILRAGDTVKITVPPFDENFWYVVGAQVVFSKWSSLVDTEQVREAISRPASDATMPFAVDLEDGDALSCRPFVLMPVYGRDSVELLSER